MADKQSGFSTVPSVRKRKVRARGEFETIVEQFEWWVGKQCLPVEAAVTTVVGAVTGAITGVVMDVLFESVCSAFSIQIPSSGSSVDPEFAQFLARFGGYQPLIQSIISGPRLEQARSFAVMYGVESGISCVMKRLRAKDDVHTSMVAGFGSGVVLSLVTGMRGPEVLSVGVMFALVNGGFFKVKEKLSHSKAEVVRHDKTRGVFSCIGFGLDHDVMNFKSGLFSDNSHNAYWQEGCEEAHGHG